eukprot:bmy_09346T0
MASNKTALQNMGKKQDGKSKKSERKSLKNWWWKKTELTCGETGTEKGGTKRKSLSGSESDDSESKKRDAAGQSKRLCRRSDPE